MSVNIDERIKCRSSSKRDLVYVLFSHPLKLSEHYRIALVLAKFKPMSAH